MKPNCNQKNNRIVKLTKNNTSNVEHPTEESMNKSHTSNTVHVCTHVEYQAIGGKHNHGLSLPKNEPHNTTYEH